MQALVECLFERGLVKMIFATETLAAGIHMPARSVIITALQKKAVGKVERGGGGGGMDTGYINSMYRCIYNDLHIIYTIIYLIFNGFRTIARILISTYYTCLCFYCFQKYILYIYFSSITHHIIYMLPLSPKLKHHGLPCLTAGWFWAPLPQRHRGPTDVGPCWTTGIGSKWSCHCPRPSTLVHGKKNVTSQSLLTYSKIYVVMLFSAFQKKTTENSWLFFWKLLRHMWKWV